MRSAVGSGWLEGKSVIVTGGGRGIGAAIVRGAAAQGASVVVNDLDAEPAEIVAVEIRESGGRAVAYAADVSDWEQAGGLIDCAIAEFGRLDGLVNNAGTFSMSLPQDQDPVELQRVLRINVMSVACCGLQAIRHMVPAGSGSIVNVTSSSMAGQASMGAYGASKGAVAGLTYAWALDLTGSGVRVNAVSPIGYTRLHLLRLDYEQIEGEERERAIAERAVDPAVNAAPACFLLSDRSAHVNGQILQIVRGNRIGLLRKPSLDRPLVEVNPSVPDEVLTAFARTLDAQIEPIGVDLNPPEGK